MADSTLDDLILNDPEPEKGKSKSLLLLLGLIILLIIVGAILAKMIFATDSTNSETNITQEKSVETTIDNNLASSNTTDTNSNIKEVDQDLAPLDDMNDTVDITIGNETPAEATAQGVVIEKQAESTPKNTSTPTKESKKSKESEKAKVVKKEQPKKAKEDKKSKPIVTHTKKVYGGHGNVYIQVGSFVKGPESSFIEKIRRAGFKFRIKEQNGKRRVYVGPFKSRQEASSLLNIVRSKINPDAFIK